MKVLNLLALLILNVEIGIGSANASETQNVSTSHPTITTRNDLTCPEAEAQASLLLANKSRSRDGLFKGYEEGDTIEIRIISEDVFNTKYLSGTYKVGANSSIRLKDGHIISKSAATSSLEDNIKSYLKSIYGYSDVIVTSSTPPSVDFVLRGEVPLQGFLNTKRSRASRETQDLQVNQADPVSNDLGEYIKQRRIFTVYSDPSCVIVARHATSSVLKINVIGLIYSGVDISYVPLYNKDIVYVPKISEGPSLRDAQNFASSPYASDVQISITGWGARPKIFSAPSGTSLFEMITNSDSLNRGFSKQLKVYRYNSSSSKFEELKISYPIGARTFFPKDKDIVSVGKDAWTSSLATLNELTSPLISALSSFFFLGSAATTGTALFGGLK